MSGTIATSNPAVELLSRVSAQEKATLTPALSHKAEGERSRALAERGFQHLAMERSSLRATTPTRRAASMR